jgi:hypothetical protein
MAGIRSECFADALIGCNMIAYMLGKRVSYSYRERQHLFKRLKKAATNS